MVKRANNKTKLYNVTVFNQRKIIMTKTYIEVPPVNKREYMNDSYYHQLTSESRFVQLYPGDTHSKWGEVIDAWSAGIKIRITRVKNNLSTSNKKDKRQNKL